MGAGKRGYMGVLERGSYGKPAPPPLPPPWGQKVQGLRRARCRAGCEESITLVCGGDKSSPGTQGKARGSASGLSRHATARSGPGPRLTGSQQQGWEGRPLQRPWLGPGSGLLLPVQGRGASGGREAGHSARPCGPRRHASRRRLRPGFRSHLEHLTGTQHFRQYLLRPRGTREEDAISGPEVCKEAQRKARGLTKATQLSSRVDCAPDSPTAGQEASTAVPELEGHLRGHWRLCISGLLCMSRGMRRARAAPGSGRGLAPQPALPHKLNSRSPPL